MTTGSTAASGIDLNTQGRVEGFVVLLFQDPMLKGLFDVAFQILESRRFACNFTRLLHQYSQDLSKEACTLPQKQAALFVKQKARYTSSLITENYDPVHSRLALPLEDPDLGREKQLKRFLAGHLLQPVPDLEEENDEGDDGGTEVDDGGNEVDDVGDIADVVLDDLRQFLMAGNAFENLRKRFRGFYSNQVKSRLSQT
jgi:hypothetical protein